MVLVIFAVLVIMGLVTAQKIVQHTIEGRYSDDFRFIQNQFDQIHSKTTQSIGKLTGNWCTACSFADSQTEKSQATALIINNNTWTNLWFVSAPEDPYGNAYTLDENEHELGASDCRLDAVISAGPDGIFFTRDDVVYKISDPACPQ